MAKPKAKKKKTTEEKLAQQRLHKRQKYEEIKKDPEKYAAQKEKERLRYLKRKEQNKIKSVKDLTPRQQRQKRKQWRENRQRYIEKKKKEKAIEQMLVDNSPPTSDDETIDRQVPQVNEVDPLEGPSTNQIEVKNNKGDQFNKKCENCVKRIKTIRRIRYIYTKIIGILKKEIQKEQNEKRELKKIVDRLRRENIKTKKENPSTEQKIESLIDKIDKGKKVKKKLIFGEVISKQLKEGFKTLRKTDKRKFSDVIVKDKESFKKHRLTTAIMPFTLRNKKQIHEDQEKEIKREIEEFFDEDSNTRIAADKKECIKKSGLTKQKRYLTDTLINLHKKFNETHKEVSYSTFCKYRPFWVVYPKESDRNTCSCVKHVNMDLLVKSLQRNKIIKEANGSMLLESLCCDVRREKCLNRTCGKCKTKVIEYGEFYNDKPLKYYQWETKTVTYVSKDEEKDTKKTKKTEMEDLPLTIIKKVEDSLPHYFEHCLNIVQQYKNIDNLKKTLTPNEALIHMDFSENYIAKFHEEVQSHHFGSSPEQISLHTSVVYLLDTETGVHKTHSMCTMSECTRHDAESVWAHIIPIIEFVKSSSVIDTLHFLTDSPSSQYRNRKIFYIISQLQHMFPDLKAISWNYLETGHGKGAPDGIGAVVKRTADKTVRFGRDVGTLKDFWLVMKEKIKNIEMRIITRKDIEERTTPSNIKTFKGTMSVHQVLWSAGSLRMTFRKLSCFFCPNGITCTHGYHLGYMDVPEDTIPQEQEQVLHDFLDTNTTPEMIEEVTNSPKRYLTSFNNVEDIQHSYPDTQKVSVSPKVKILSDVRLHWSNTSFSFKTPTHKQQRFQSNFENFITSNKISKPAESSAIMLEDKKKTKGENQNKEIFF